MPQLKSSTAKYGEHMYNFFLIKIELKKKSKKKNENEYLKKDKITNYIKKNKNNKIQCHL